MAADMQAGYAGYRDRVDELLYALMLEELMRERLLRTGAHQAPQMPGIWQMPYRAYSMDSFPFSRRDAYMLQNYTTPRMRSQSPESITGVHALPKSGDVAVPADVRPQSPNSIALQSLDSLLGDGQAYNSGTAYNSTAPGYARANPAIVLQYNITIACTPGTEPFGAVPNAYRRANGVGEAVQGYRVVGRPQRGGTGTDRQSEYAGATPGYANAQNTPPSSQN